MKDFAYWLRVNRERAGLNQAQLAAQIAQSSSYISMLESRRKPPPSDEVVCRIARALDIEERRLLEVAHIERTPPDIQRKVLDLSQQVEAGASRRKSLLHRLLPAALFPALATRAVEPDDLPVPKATQRLLERVAQHVGGVLQYDLFAELVVNLFDELGDNERETLLELAGDLAAATISGGRAASGRHAAPQSAQLPILLDVPAGAVADELDDASGFQEVAPSDAGPERYGLIIHGNDLYPRIEHGDLVIVDLAREPANGNLVAVLHDGHGSVMRYLTLATHVELTPLDPRQAPLLLDETSTDLAVRGVVIRIVRTPA